MGDAVEAAVDLHAKSADPASSEVGEAGLTPSDVIEGLRILLKDMTKIIVTESENETMLAGEELAKEILAIDKDEINSYIPRG